MSSKDESPDHSTPPLLKWTIAIIMLLTVLFAIDACVNKVVEGRQETLQETKLTDDEAITKAWAAVNEGKPDAALKYLAGNFTLEEIKANSGRADMLRQIETKLIEEEGKTLAEEAIKMAFLPPVKTGLNKSQLLEQAQSEIDAGVPMRAFETIRANTTGDQAYTDPEIKSLGNRATEMVNENMKVRRIADYAERASGYWPERLAAVNVKSARTGVDLLGHVMLFEDIARFTPFAEVAHDPTVKSAQAKLRKTLRARQVELFPQIRKQYADLLARGLWENDVYVTSRGRTLIFTGSMFISNANIAPTQREIEDMARRMRFTRVEYRWHASSGGQYYDLEVPADSAIGMWRGSTFSPAL